MNTSTASLRVNAARTLIASLLTTGLALAAPGAHGPNGEHLDSAHTTQAASAVPRIEARTENFELVGELRAGELSMLIDRYDTNEPVLDAQLEVESGGVKAPATFRATQGDYVVSDAPLLASLTLPGTHALVFTLVTRDDSDLLEGTLTDGKPSSAAHTEHRHHDHAWERRLWLGSGMLVLGLMGGLIWRQRRMTGKSRRVR